MLVGRGAGETTEFSRELVLDTRLPYTEWRADLLSRPETVHDHAATRVPERDRGVRGRSGCTKGSAMACSIVS